MAVTIEQLENWMKSDEGENLEFKEAKAQYDLTKLHRYCVALYNEGGGKLILSVNDDKLRKVVGSNAFLNLNDIKSKVYELFNPETKSIAEASRKRQNYVKIYYRRRISKSSRNS